MLASEALNLTFKELTLNYSCALKIALRDEEISQGGDRSYAQLVATAKVHSKISDQPFQ
jgi:hypothetical protein